MAPLNFNWTMIRSNSATAAAGSCMGSVPKLANRSGQAVVIWFISSLQSTEVAFAVAVGNS